MKTFKELYEACCAACEKRADIEEVKEPTGGLKDACWKGYTAVGMKMKNGRKVPNCVPANEEVEIDEDDLSVRTLYDKYADRTANAKNTKPVEKAIKKVHGSKVLSHMKKAASANIDTKFDKEKQHFDKARKAAGNTDMIGATVGKNRSAFRNQYEEVETAPFDGGQVKPRRTDAKIRAAVSALARKARSEQKQKNKKDKK